MYNVLDVSRYIIKYSNEKEYGISSLKLQKVLYFVQAYFLISKPDESPCFRERIEAWDFGPIVPEVYCEYKQYGSSNIPTVLSFIDIDENNLWNSKRVKYHDTSIDSDDKELIRAVVDKFSDFTATDLVKITHRQAPWKDAYEPHMNNEITIEAIKKYFDN